MFVYLTRACLVSLFSLSIISCAYTPTHSRYDTTVKSWIGSSISSLSQKWGYPDERVALDKGRSVYIYKRQTVQTMPGFVQPGQIEMPGPGGNQFSVQQSDYINTFVKSCTTEFITNEKEIITEVLYTGNNCRFTRDDEKDFVHNALNAATHPSAL